MISSVIRGWLTIAARPIAATKSPTYDRCHPMLIDFKLRKRIVLTINSAGTSTTASAGSACRHSWSPTG